MAVSSRVKRQIIRKIYNKLEKRFGDLGWWPASSRFEVIIGAVLTQNTAWKNVERAIAELKRERVMSPGKILRIS
ncbi:MAG: endonuclease III domain-containing protein, partial [Candidatus Omnitrophota bacterium]